jgi:iron-sulfur cluster assembly accessory protein
MITLTQRAADRVRDLLQREGRPKAALRLRVTAGGCSGFRYELAFDEMRDADHALEQHGVPIVIDAESVSPLQGCILDYADGLNESGFQIENPNAEITCGCGESFGV